LGGKNRRKYTKERAKVELERRIDHGEGGRQEIKGEGEEGGGNGKLGVAQRGGLSPVSKKLSSWGFD